MANFIKDPQAKLDFTVDWSDWLGLNEIIVSSSWSSPDGLTIETSGYDSNYAVVWLSGGTAGTTYRLINTITTNSSPARIDQRTITIKAQER